MIGMPSLHDRFQATTNQGKHAVREICDLSRGNRLLTKCGALLLTDIGFLGDAFAERIRECLIDLLVARGPGRTICMSEVAQALATRSGYHWHDLMRPVRMVCVTLSEEGAIEAIQHEETVDIRSARGPIRLRLRALPGQRSAQMG